MFIHAFTLFMHMTLFCTGNCTLCFAQDALLHRTVHSLFAQDAICTGHCTGRCVLLHRNFFCTGHCTTTTYVSAPYECKIHPKIFLQTENGIFGFGLTKCSRSDRGQLQYARMPHMLVAKDATGRYLAYPMQLIRPCSSWSSALSCRSPWTCVGFRCCLSCY
jgi:hypothetical protein